jgi:hypothetical protein
MPQISPKLLLQDLAEPLDDRPWCGASSTRPGVCSMTISVSLTTAERKAA